MERQLYKYVKKIFLHSRPLYNLVVRLQDLVRYALHSPHEDDFLIFKHLNGSGVFVDIGANRGQSALSFASINRNFSIVSFEPNPSLENDLRRVKKILGKRFEYVISAIGKQRSTSPFYIPKIKNILIYGEGTFNKNSLLDPDLKDRVGGKFEVAEYKFNIAPFSDFNITPDIIKLTSREWNLKCSAVWQQ